jgi:hypothetical protein
MQQIFYNPAQSMNAFTAGEQLGERRRKRETQNVFSGMIGNKDYEGARDYAYSRGAMDLGGAADGVLAGQAQQAKTAEKEKMRQLYEVFKSVRAMDPENPRARLAEAQRLSQGLGLPGPTDIADVSDDELAYQVRRLGIQGGFQEEAGEGFSLSQGQARYDANGNIVAENAKPVEAAARKTIQGADGYQYYMDTGERVLPGVNKPAPAPTDPWKVVATGDGNSIMYNSQTGEWEAFRGEADFSDMPPAFAQSGQAEQDGGNYGAQFIPVGYPESQREGNGLGGFMNANGYDSPFTEFLGEQVRTEQPSEQPNAARYHSYKGSEQAKSDVKRLEGINSKAISVLNEQQPALEQMKDLVNKGLPIGPLAGVRTTAGELGAPGAMSKQQAGRMRAFNRLSTQLQLELTQLTKGAISDTEWQAFRDAVPTWTQSPEGVQEMIFAFERANQRVLEYQQASNQWDQFYGGLSMPNEFGDRFDTVWAKYSKASPLIAVKRPLSLKTMMDGVTGAVGATDMSDDDLLESLGLAD